VKNFVRDAADSVASKIIWKNKRKVSCIFTFHIY
jgi:hypothetical protein